MTTNLLDLLNQAVTPDLLGALGKNLRESESALGTGIKALLPALLGGMAQKASTAEGASSLFGLVTADRIEADFPERLPTLVRSVQAGNLVNLGGELMTSLFGGGREGAVGSALAAPSGLRAASASTLAATTVPMVFGLIKRLVGERALDASGLATLLLGQRGFLAGKLDAGLLSALGLGSPAGLLDGLGSVAARLTGGAASAAHGAGAAAASTAGAAAAAAQGGSQGRIFAWIIGAAVVLYLLSQLSNCGGTPSAPASLPPPAATSSGTTTAASGATTPAAPATGGTATTASPVATPAAPAAGDAAAGAGGSGQISAGAGSPGAASPVGSATLPAGSAGTGSTGPGSVTPGAPGGTGSPPATADSAAAAATAAPAGETAAATAPGVASPASPATEAAADVAIEALPARVYFETGSAVIGPRGEATIAAVARLIAAGTPAKVELTGLTDRTGDLAINEALSKKRALAVQAALVAAGVPEADIGLKPPMFVEAGGAGADAEARRVEITAAQ